MDYSKESNKIQRKKVNSPIKKTGHFVGGLLRRVIVIGVVVGIFTLVGGGIGLYMGILESAPAINEIKVVPENYTSIFYQEGTGKEIDKLYSSENREYASISTIPKHLQNAVVAIEDKRFYSHNGVDFESMVRAVYVNITSRSLGEGASTITQQILKNNVFKDNSKKWIRKLQEQYLAVKFESILTEQMGGDKAKAKNYILELYLNTIGLAHGLNGVRSAALYYFGKNLQELTLSECAIIAAITNRPEAYEPVKNSEVNKQRRDRILRNMLEQDMITQQEHDTAVADTEVYQRILEARAEVENDGPAHSYYVEQAISEIARDLQIKYAMDSTQAYNLIYSGGLKMYLPVDLEMQAIVDESYKKEELFPPKASEWQVDYYVSILRSGQDQQVHPTRRGFVKTEEEIEPLIESFREELVGEGDKIVAERYEKVMQPQSAMVVLDYHTGQVKAFAASRGEKPDTLRPFNRATQAKRQPGSTFKVLASYAAALDLGKLTAATMMMDEPYKVGDKQFSNWYEKTRGYMGLQSVRTGIAYSMNILAVRTLMEYTTIDTAFDYLQNFGFTTLVEERVVGNQVMSDKIPALALGGITDGVTPLELAAAYGTIANLGEYNKPIFYTKVLDHDNQVLLENITEPRRVLKASTAYILTDIMKDSITGPLNTGRLANFSEVKMPIAGKTGTTTDDYDVFFAGYTPYYVASVWMGHDQPKKLVYDKSYHLLLWKDIMEQIHANLEYKDFVQPDGVIRKSVCTTSGKLPIPGLCDIASDGKVINELFVQGTAPTSSCDVHEPVQICTASDKLVTEFCPADLISTKVRRKLSSESGDASTQASLYCNVHTNVETLPEDTVTDNPDVSIPTDWLDEDLFPNITDPEIVNPPPDENIDMPLIIDSFEP